MGFMKGIGKSSIRSGSPDNIRAGSYLLEIIEAKGGVSRKDIDYVVFNFRVKAAEDNGGGNPNKVGTRVRAYYKLSRTRDNSLDEDGQRWMERLKTFLAAVLGGDEATDENGEPDPITDEDVTEMVAGMIIKGTEFKVAQYEVDRDDFDTDEAFAEAEAAADKKLAALAREIAAKSVKDGGLAMTPEEIADAEGADELLLVDYRGTIMQLEAKLNDKGNFVNQFWRLHVDEDEDAE